MPTSNGASGASPTQDRGAVGRRRALSSSSTTSTLSSIDTADFMEPAESESAVHRQLANEHALATRRWADDDLSVGEATQGDAQTPPPLPYTFSAGVAAALPGDDVADVVRRADDALYAAKTAGRDQLVVAPCRA